MRREMAREMEGNMMRVYVKARGTWSPTDSVSDDAETLARFVRSWRAFGYRVIALIPAEG